MCEHLCEHLCDVSSSAESTGQRPDNTGHCYDVDQIEQNPQDTVQTTQDSVMMLIR